MTFTRPAPGFALALLLTFAAPIAAPGRSQVALATQAPSFTLPTQVPSGTTVRLDGDPNLLPISQALKSKFEQQFAGTKVQIAEAGAVAALKALAAGEVDLVALGRPLSAAERAAGLVAVPLTRRKIAVIIGPDNGFKGSLTNRQFAKILQGEITNWSQVGGPDLPIRVLHRTADSDTRLSLANYPVFQANPEKSPPAAKPAGDDTEPIIKQLGKDGISYALVDQVGNRPDVRVVPLHKVLADDQRYSFSQPLVYVYQGPNPSVAVQSFLGYATAPAQQAVITTALAPTAVPAPEATGATSPSPTQTTAPAATAPTATEPAQPEPIQNPTAQTGSESGSESGGISPWWLLLLPLLGLPLLAGRRRRDKPSQPHSEPSVLAGKTKDEVTGSKQVEEHLGSLKNTGINQEALSTPAASTAVTSTPAVSTPAVDIYSADTIPGTTLTRELLDGAGAAGTAAGVAGLAAGAAGLGGLAAMLGVEEEAGTTQLEAIPPSELTLVAQDHQSARARWKISPAQQRQLQHDGGEFLKLRLYDVTDTGVPSSEKGRFQDFDCDEQGAGAVVPISRDNRRYVAELGYQTLDNRWLPLATSNPIQAPAAPGTTDSPSTTTSSTTTSSNAASSATVMEVVPPIPPQPAQSSPVQENQTVQENLKIGETSSGTTSPNVVVNPTSWQNLALPTVAAAGAAGMAAVAAAQTLANKSQLAEVASQEVVKTVVAETDVARTTVEPLPTAKVNLVAQDALHGTVSWQIPAGAHQQLQSLGAEQFALRVYDATPHAGAEATHPAYRQYNLNPEETQTQVILPTAYRDYQAELGYLTQDYRWLPLARSGAIHIDLAPPTPVAPSVATPDTTLEWVEPTVTTPAVGSVDNGAVAPVITHEEDLCWIEITPYQPTLATVIEPADPDQALAYIHWQVSDRRRQAIKAQGGRFLALRVHDAHLIDLDLHPPHHTDEYLISEQALDKVAVVPEGERDYVAEIGYLTSDGRFLSLRRSIHARIPHAAPVPQ